mgnify:CR=1 FL=1
MTWKDYLEPVEIETKKDCLAKHERRYIEKRERDSSPFKIGEGITFDYGQRKQ